MVKVYFLGRFILAEVLKLTGFILVVIGFLGLIINEFALDLGRVATIIFAIIDAAGLALLAWVHWGMKKT